MKRTTYAVLAGSFAFGLTAAAAQVVQFAIDSIDPVPATAEDNQVIVEEPCTGQYDLSWTYSNDPLTLGQVTGVVGTRTPATVLEDDRPELCQNVRVHVEVAQVGGATWTTYGITDETDGGFDLPFFTSFIAKAGDDVTLTIGPDAPTS